MNAPIPLPGFVDALIRGLRRYGLPLGVDDCNALQAALAAGFGWESTGHLQELCVSLWAKSREEAAIVRAVFARVSVPPWDVAEPVISDPADPAVGEAEPAKALPVAHGPELPAEIRPATGTGSPPLSGKHDAGLLLVPQYPVGERAIVQVWRRLRRRVRQGPATCLDVTATVERRARVGVAVPPVLVAPQRNAARLVLLIDRDGSMAPYHRYVEHVCRAIRQASRYDLLTVAYFHDVPGHGDRSVLAAAAPHTANLDSVLDRIRPLHGGTVYADTAATEPIDLAVILDTLNQATSVAVISDAGAARGSLDVPRLLDSVALARAVTGRRATLAWLNPAPRDRWRRSTAELIARHVPMQPLDLSGMYRTIDSLRGRHTAVERPL